MQDIAKHFSDYDSDYDVALIELPESFMRRGDYSIKNVKSIQKLMMSIGAIVGGLAYRYRLVFVNVGDWKGREKKVLTQAVTESLTGKRLNNHEADAYLMAVNWQSVITGRRPPRKRSISKFLQSKSFRPSPFRKS